MRTIKEIDEDIVKEYSYMNQLYAQINSYEQSIKHLKAERENVKKEEEKLFIDNWLNDHFGISSQKEARQKSIFIVFDKNANFVKTVTTGHGEEFLYVSPVEDKDTMEHWLKKTSYMHTELHHFATETEVGMIYHSKSSLKICAGNLTKMEN